MSKIYDGLFLGRLFSKKIHKCLKIPYICLSILSVSEVYSKWLILEKESEIYMSPRDC